MVLKNQIKMTNKIITKFVRKLTIKGKKFKSLNFFKNSIKLIQKNSKKSHKNLIQFSFVNISPLFNLKSIKKKRKNPKEFPFFITNNSRILLAIKFILEKHPFYDKKLHKKFILIMKKNSNIFQKKKSLNDLTYRQKKYSNYRWF